jgi:hypothetical protein
MSEQQDTIADFEASGVLEGIRWANRSAVARTLADYSEAAGHDATWLGMNRFILYRNRLDRVFSCLIYSVSSDSHDPLSLDVLHAELSALDVATFPQIEPGLVVRNDLNGSPGWVFQGKRFLLASCAYGKLKTLPWPQKSRTKKFIARQHYSEAIQDSLFEGLLDFEIPGLLALQSKKSVFDIPTFVVAHALDPVSKQVELVFGRPRFNSHGSEAWHWLENLFMTPPPSALGRKEGDYLPSGPSAVDDAPVRLRSNSDQKFDKGMNGEK